MKNILTASLIALALAAHAAPDASLSAQSPFLQTLEKHDPQTYQTLSGDTLADIYQTYHPQLLQRLQESSDATFSQYADSFTQALAQLGKEAPAACQGMLSGRRTPTLLDLQLALNTNAKHIDQALQTLLEDAGGWQLPENHDGSAIGSELESLVNELRNNGHNEGISYIFEGKKAETPAQQQAACNAAIAFFKALNQAKDSNKIIALRFILATS
ncbi:MAG: hypothetical protein Q4D61_01925 [Cardiobacteriaceae bacterium]|nr:hypothetical protein [Cardiobacteriaceae bacterium]